MKRLIMVVMLLSLIHMLPVGAESDIKIGDYVQMGKYYDETILWRCVDIDEKGPLMLSDKILSIKSFDAAGKHTNDQITTGMPLQSNGTINSVKRGDKVGDDPKRLVSGSNLWETSNIRSWLNSTEDAKNINWLCGNQPDTTYTSEKGFLEKGNFKDSEKNVMKSVTQKVLLNNLDRSLAINSSSEINLDYSVDSSGGGGTNKFTAYDYNASMSKLTGQVENEYTYSQSISELMGNYDVFYFNNVMDNVFLLDIKQLNRVYNNSTILGDKYYIGQPTEKAVENSQYKKPSLSANEKWQTWIRNAAASPFETHDVYYLYSNGIVYKRAAADINVGIRPAFYMDVNSVVFKSGNGSLQNPYLTDTISVLFDDKMVSFDQSPVIENGRTLVPMRAIFEAMGAKVSWDDKTKTVTATKDNTVIKMQINNKTMVLNEQNITLDVEAKIVNGRTVVPARAVAEGLNAKVEWDANNYTVNISTK